MVLTTSHATLNPSPAVVVKVHIIEIRLLFSLNSELVWRVGRYTSAAPVYFTECDNFVDGGLLANNPCSDALTRIQVYTYTVVYKLLYISIIINVKDICVSSFYPYF